MDMPAKIATRPFWFPADLEWESLPNEFRVAVDEIICPLYQTLVLDEADPVARAAGTTLTFLTCLELAEQIQLGKGLANANAVSDSFAKQFNRLLNVVEQKGRVQASIIRWRDHKAREASLGLSYFNIRELVNRCTSSTLHLTEDEEWNQANSIPN